MRFIRTRRYSQDLKRLRLTDKEAAAIEAAIVARPDAGDVIVGSGGARKLRFALGSRGKSGGGRAIYLLILDEDTTALLMAYGKNEKSDLSPADRRALDVIMKEMRS